MSEQKKQYFVMNGEMAVELPGYDELKAYLQDNLDALHETKRCVGGWHVWPNGKKSGACECGAFDPFVNTIEELS